MSDDGAVLFCPFCRDPVEGQRVCPEHGLRLVSFQQLPPRTRSLSVDTRLPLWTPGHGRLWVAVGAVLLLCAFALPLARLAGDVAAESTLWDLAQGRSKTLWLVPAAGCAQLALLYRRRTLRTLRSIRLAVLWLALLPAGVVALTWAGVQDAARALDAAATHGVQLLPGLGTWVLAVATFCSLLGSIQLGRPGRSPAQRVEEVQ